MNKKALSYTTGSLLLLVGLWAAVGGIWMMFQPDGILGLNTELLKNSPFNNYFYPGLLLLIINGVLSLIVAFLAFRDHRYAAIGTGPLGVLMIVWIGIQVHWIGWISWLEPTFIGVGVVELALGYFLNRRHPENGQMFTKHHGSPSH